MHRATEPLIFELSKSGRVGVVLPKLDVPRSDLPGHLLRDELPLPEVSEVDANAGTLCCESLVSNVALE